MPNEVQYAFPAGDESDGSNDKWDIGSSKYKKDPLIEVTHIHTSNLAINTGDVQLVHQLLENGLDVETKLGFERTPLMCAMHVAHYDIAKFLLHIGASANFGRYTVLMHAWLLPARSSSEIVKIVKCVELLLSRNADHNTFNKSRMTSLMLVSRDGYSQVINLLVSHGAEVNSQGENGYTVLTVAVQYGREEPVLKLLQLGADKTKAGKIEDFGYVSSKRPQIGISNPEDQQKVLSVVKEMHLDRVDLDTLSQLENINSGSEELYNFLIKTVQNVISRFSRGASELVLSLDPKKEAQAICNELVAQTGDQQKEVTSLPLFLLSLLGHSERMNESPVSLSSIRPCTPFYCPLFPSGPIPNFSQTRVNSHFAPSLCVGSCV
uniref:Ankyrin repeat, SAM and basic leucine zipper domain containing 1 n=1 Tax=Salmo trutta TaxID=8032 RepID=A0A673Z0G9_SALTR